MKHRPTTYILIGAVIALFSIFSLPKEEEQSSIRDFNDIMSQKELKVTTEYGSNTYFIDESGNLQGEHFELISEFAKQHDLRLTIIPEMSISRQNEMIHNGECDLIVTPRPLNAETENGLRQTIPLGVDKQIVVQRKKSPATDSLSTDSCMYLNSLIDLGGKSICMPKDSPFKHRLANLMEEIGDTIIAYEIPRYNTEQLIALVAHGDICYAICEEDIVKKNMNKYTNLDNRLAFSFNQFYAWTVSERSPILLDSLNAWITKRKMKNSNRITEAKPAKR